MRKNKRAKAKKWERHYNRMANIYMDFGDTERADQFKRMAYSYRKVAIV